MSEAKSIPQLESRVAELEERLADMDARLGEERGLMGLVEQMMPAEAVRHLRTARKEQLLAVRSVLDAWIGRLEREPAEPRRRREDISID